MSMKFKVTIEKLKKGWSVVLPVTSERKGRALVTQLNDAHVATHGEKAKKYKGLVTKIGNGYGVKLYQSKLKYALPLVKERFIAVRDEQETAAR